MTDNSVDDIKAYLWWTLIDGTAGRLSMDMDRANWDFSAKHYVVPLHKNH